MENYPISCAHPSYHVIYAVGYRTQRDGTTAAADERGPRNIDLSGTDEERDKVNLKGITGHKKHIRENTQYSCFMLCKYFLLSCL